MRNLARHIASATALACALLTTSVATAQDLTSTVASWEKRLDVRIGVVLCDRNSDWQIKIRADEPFPMSSTFKALLCGAILQRVDAGKEDLSRRISFGTKDIVRYSPVTEKHLETGLTIAELCEATMTLSDNSAANLLLATMGGPEGLTRFLRSIGDKSTRLDRWETALNEAKPGDPRDTTTPATILRTLEKLLHGDILKPASAAQLRQWMIDDKVADALIRAHLPEGWTIGDKSGAGGHGSRAIIAFIEPDEDRSYLASIYVTDSTASFKRRNQVLADIGRAMIAEIKAR